MTMTIDERPDQDSRRAVRLSPRRRRARRLCTRGSSPGPRRKACSMSPTAPSTPLSARCCWPPPRPGWFGSRTSVKASTRCSSLAGRISPRILSGPAAARRGRPPARGVLRRPAHHLRPAARPPPLGRFPPLGAGLSSGHRLWADRQLPVRGRRSAQPEGRAGRRHGVRHQPLAGRHPLPPGHPLRRAARRLPRRPRDQAPAARPGGAAMTALPTGTPPPTGGGSTAPTGRRSQPSSTTSAAPCCHACSPSLTPVN